jgi:Tfp pilus assembly pilus retraction ATPase PilT
LIEDPIEYLQEDLPNGSTFLHQEIGRSAKSFPDALFYNFRQKPHLVLIAELREKDAAVAALDLALSGHLVVTTIHANDSIAALRRFHSYVEKVEGATESLAQALQMVIAQKLLAAGPSAPLVSLHEILLTNDAVRATIRKGPLEFDSLRLVVDNSREDGMQSYHTSIKNRIREGKLPAGFAGD